MASAAQEHGTKCSALAAKQATQPWKKDGALNLSLAKPPELQVHWSVALQVAPATLWASWDTNECPAAAASGLCRCSQGSQKGAWGILQPPALGTYQESQVWLAGREKLADSQVECHDPSDSFLPLLPSSPPHCLSGLEGGVPGARQGVGVLGRCCCFAFWAVFCVWVCRQLFACCFSNHAWRSLIHRIASVRASVWQLGTTVSLEQRRPVSCRVVLVKTCPICCFLSPFLSVLLTHAVWSAQLSIAVTSHFELPLLWLMFAFSLGKC